MAMASFSPQSSSHLYGHHSNHHSGHAKITKARSRQAVKPILKKLHSHSHSHSEKNSLDLDRSWDEQGHIGSYPYSPVDEEGAALGPSYTANSPAIGSQTRPRDVSFSLSATDVSTGGIRGNKYSHARSTSGTSVATSNSAGRNGSFVHPFQQTPRTSTPPLSYAASLASLDNPSASRDYSPTITEDGDDTDVQPSQSATRIYHLPHSNHRRPSLASQRTSSLSDVNQPVRVTNGPRISTGVASRNPPSLMSRSRSDLRLNTSSTTAFETPVGTSPPGGSLISSHKAAGSSPSTSALSPLRTSLDMNGFRLRSRSEVDTATRQEHVREARRKFEEKEKAKEEKFTRDQIRKQERAESKEAHRLARSHTRKSSFGTSRMSCDQTSSHTDLRPSFSRKNTNTGPVDNEKLEFTSRGYDTVASGQTPHARADEVQFQSTRRNNTTKKKTNGAWTAFVLWLRTRLLKMGRR